MEQFFIRNKNIFIYLNSIDYAMWMRHIDKYLKYNHGVPRYLYFAYNGAWGFLISPIINVYIVRQR